MALTWHVSLKTPNIRSKTLVRLRIGTSLLSSRQAVSHPTLGPWLQLSHFSTAAWKPKQELHKDTGKHTQVHMCNWILTGPSRHRGAALIAGTVLSPLCTQLAEGCVTHGM